MRGNKRIQRPVDAGRQRRDRPKSHGVSSIIRDLRFCCIKKEGEKYSAERIDRKNSGRGEGDRIEESWPLRVSTSATRLCIHRERNRKGKSSNVSFTLSFLVELFRIFIFSFSELSSLITLPAIFLGRVYSNSRTVPEILRYNNNTEVKIVPCYGSSTECLLLYLCPKIS